MTYTTQFHPDVVLKDPLFKIIPNDGVLPTRDTNKNLALFYNEKKVSRVGRTAQARSRTDASDELQETHIVEKPIPTAGEGQVVVHVRATGSESPPPHFPQSSSAASPFHLFVPMADTWV